MQTQLMLKRAAQCLIFFSALALLSVSIMAFNNPQSVMDLVGVKLTNTDAYSSIRGVYGGVGLALFLSLIYLMFRGFVSALAFLTLIWGFYAISRVVTIFSEGALGPFGQRWLIIESTLFLLAAGLLVANRKAATSSKSFGVVSNYPAPSA